MNDQNNTSQAKDSGYTSSPKPTFIKKNFYIKNRSPSKNGSISYRTLNQTSEKTEIEPEKDNGTTIKLKNLFSKQNEDNQLKLVENTPRSKTSNLKIDIKRFNPFRQRTPDKLSVNPPSELMRDPPSPESKTARSSRQKSFDKKLKLTVLRQMSPESINKFYDMYSNSHLASNLKDIVKTARNRQSPLQLDKINSTKHQKSLSYFPLESPAFHLGILESRPTVVRETIKDDDDPQAKEIEKEKLIFSEICKKHDLSPKKLLGADVESHDYEVNFDIIKPFKPLESRPHVSELEQAQREVEKGIRDLKKFQRKKRFLACRKDFDQEFRQNRIFHQETLERAKTLSQGHKKEDRKNSPSLKKITKGSTTDNDLSVSKSNYLLPPLQLQMSTEYYNSSIMDIDSNLKLNSTTLDQNKSLFYLKNNPLSKAYLTDRNNKSSINDLANNSESLKEDLEKNKNKLLPGKKDSSKVIKLIKKSFSEFNKKMEAISHTNQVETSELDQSISKTLSSVKNDYDGLMKKTENDLISKELLNLQRQRHFKNNLAEHVISKIADKYAFLHAYSAKNKNELLSENTG